MGKRLHAACRCLQGKCSNARATCMKVCAAAMRDCTSTGAIAHCNVATWHAHVPATPSGRGMHTSSALQRPYGATAVRIEHGTLCCVVMWITGPRVNYHKDAHGRPGAFCQLQVFTVVPQVPARPLLAWLLAAPGIPLAPMGRHPCSAHCCHQLAELQGYTPADCTQSKMSKMSQVQNVSRVQGEGHQAMGSTGPCAPAGSHLLLR